MALEPLSAEQLISLARQKSDQAREQLFEAMGDVFLERNTVLTLQERALITDILEKLIREVSREIRRKLAVKLAEAPGTPRELAVLLANDEIDIASPVLIRSKVLEDADLIEIVRNRSTQHLLAIAMRRDLSTAVADALVESGEKDVIRTLLENQDAHISRATMAYLVEQSKAVDEFQEPLVKRRDLPGDLARRMCLWVSAAIRQSLLERFSIDVDKLDDSLEPIAREEAERLQEADPDAAGALAQALGEGRKLTPRLLMQTLRRGEVPLFEAMLAEMSGLRPALIRRLCYEPGGQGLAVVARGIGLSREEFASIYLLTRKARPGGMSLDPADLGRALEFFDRINHGNAATVIGRWRRDPDYLYAIRSVEEQQGRQRA
ncbi:DUF2336 domain-containing protein [Dongia sedimenti]|uniref:DUF2336 domain-containing protein n=1 Tax=Dongia sedimenti TaxID=3064282 RepID=A0ABU0YQ24_9PROT|nr:DUF2336 domain-containing protein [Rhodospirillaceae bacterium R-7]